MVHLKLTTLAVIALNVLSVAHAADKPVPVSYGHKDFVPTAEQPVSFRNNNAWYPGATPPVEWYDLPATTNGPAQPSKNVYWKAKLPGWTLAHPIVVKGRVYVTGDPDWVACFDAETGKELWKKRITLPLVDGLSEAEAAKQQVAIDLAMAMYYVSAPWSDVGRGINSIYDMTDLPKGKEPEDPAAYVARKKEAAVKILAMLIRHRPQVEALGDKSLLDALDKDAAMVKSAAEAPDYETYKKLFWSDGRQGPRSLNLVKAVSGKYQTSLGYAWRGYLGSAETTLASDGERIYGQFTPGQMFCLDLDGKLLWARRDQGFNDGAKGRNWHNSPVLTKDLVLFIGFDATKRDPDKPLVALDKLTGKERWRTIAGFPGEFGITFSYGVPLVVRLPGSDGKPVEVVVTSNRGLFLRASDGQLLGKYDAPELPMIAHSLYLVGNRLLTGGLNGAKPNPNYAFDLKLDGPDKVVATQVYRIGDEKRGPISEDCFFTMSDQVILGGQEHGMLYSPKDGSQIGPLGAPSGGAWVIAGKYMIGLDLKGPKHDGVRHFANYLTIDISDPAKPQIAGHGALGFNDPAPDLMVSEYLKDFDPHDFAGCYKGSAGQFTDRMSGVVPHGDRLYIQSAAYLYCIQSEERK
jgi:hypothetical protein